MPARPSIFQESIERRRVSGVLDAAGGAASPCRMLCVETLLRCPDPSESVCEHVFGRSMQMRRQIGLMRSGFLAALTGAFVFGCAGALAQQRNAIERPGAIHTSAEGQYEYFGGLRLDP